MTRYRRVEVGTWHDRQFCELTAPPPNGQTLWLYLLCGKRTTTFPGVVIADETVIAADLKWPLEQTRAMWEEIASRGMAWADWNVGLVVLPKALLVRGVPRETSHPGSPNTLGGWAKAWGDVPECDLKDWYLLELGTFADALDELAVLGRNGKQPKQTYRSVYLNAFETSLGRVSERVRDSYPDPFETHARVPAPARDARARGPVPDPVPVSDQGSGSLGPIGKGGGSGDLTRGVGTGQRDPEMVLRRRLVDSFVERVNRARSDLSHELGLPGVRPIGGGSGGCEGERALIQRLKESADPAADMDHVITVAIEEARVSRELRWLGWSLAEPKAWRMKLATTPTEARRGRRGDSVFGAVDRAAEDLRSRPLVDVDHDPEDGAPHDA